MTKLIVLNAVTVVYFMALWMFSKKIVAVITNLYGYTICLLKMDINIES